MAKPLKSDKTPKALQENSNELELNMMPQWVLDSNGNVTAVQLTTKAYAQLLDRLTKAELFNDSLTKTIANSENTLPKGKPNKPKGKTVKDPKPKVVNKTEDYHERNIKRSLKHMVEHLEGKRTLPSADEWLKKEYGIILSDITGKA